MATPQKRDAQQPRDAPPRPSLLKRGRLYAGVALALVLLVIGAYFLLLPRQPQPVRLTITAGSAQGLRHEIAESLADRARRQGIELRVEPTSGSRDALRRVDGGQLDMALAQGGLSHADFPHIRQVAVLHVEPLHLLVKPETSADGSSADHFTLSHVSQRLKGASDLKINISTKGSGTNALAGELLKFFGLKQGVDYQATHLSYRELMDPRLAFDDLPDAVFTVSSLPSPVAKHLISEHGYRPVELAVSDAFRIDWSGSEPSRDAREVVRRSIVEATIPAFTYQVNPAVPAQPLPTLGTRLHLVAHRDTPAEAVEQVIDLIYNSSFAAVSEPPLSIALLQTSSEFDLHAGAASYLEKKTPIITERVVELTEQVLAILGTVAGAVIFIWQAMLLIRRRRRDRQFLVCIERVGQIEQRTLQYERDEQMTVDDLVDLQTELNDIKTDMIRQFQSGDIDGADTLSGFLMHVNDANENLTTLILHERQPRT